LVHGCLFWALLLFGLTGVLVGAQPAHGRWEVPQTPGVVEGQGIAKDLKLSTPVPPPAEVPQSARVPILMYHYVSELPADADHYRRDLTVTPERFEAHLRYLSEAGFHPITLTDLYLHLTEGYPLPEKPVVLTFDDGYVDAYEVAFPLLLEYGFPGTFFVLSTPAHFEAPGYLTWNQMREMSEAGMDIQSHGRDHVDLRNRSYDYLVYQTLGIQEAVRHHTGQIPRFFCYPSGRYDAGVIQALKDVGYWGAVTTEWGQTHTPEGLFLMPRLRVRGADTLESFTELLGDS
jgi:peptidoglycan/xylan/chitin deacetylase (PgdA/CDA1 family)